ncbi:MAG: glycerophosphodiester phosphodiesterase family protein [Alkalispirochaeta sp.]
MGEAIPVHILGHRGGAGGMYPENSIQAFQHGLQAGADGIELDVRLSRDNRVMVVHDPVIDRVTRGTGWVEQLGAAELRRYALVDSAGTPHGDARIPVLEELFELVGSVPVNIDLKTAEIGLARAVADIVRRYDAVDRTTVASFIPSALQLFRSIAPEVATSADPIELRALVKSRFLREPVDIPATRVQMPLRYRLFPLATKGFVKFLHGRNMAVDIWTVNSPQIALHLARIGVDGIFTDQVAPMRDALISGGTYGHE